MNYLWLKQLHIALAVISISGFVLRWIGRMRESAWAQAKVARVLPHVVDTAFLATAFLLAITLGQFPFTHAWLTAKVIGLMAYILLGALAMRSAPSLRKSLPLFIAAVLVFGWIVSVAKSKSALGFWLYFFS